MAAPDPPGFNNLTINKFKLNPQKVGLYISHLGRYAGDVLLCQLEGEHLEHGPLAGTLVIDGVDGHVETGGRLEVLNRVEINFAKHLLFLFKKKKLNKICVNSHLHGELREVVVDNLVGRGELEARVVCEGEDLEHELLVDAAVVAGLALDKNTGESFVSNTAVFHRIRLACKQHESLNRYLGGGLSIMISAYCPLKILSLIHI